MKQKIINIITLAVLLVFVSCTQGPKELTGNESISMANIDEFLDTNSRLIDLRNFSDMFNAGYISGFETVPFFQYLEGRGLIRNNGWEFSDADIVSTAVLENIFGDKDGAIILMCGSGTRAGYMKSALENLGYTKVFNAGGITDYSGAHKILGDGEYAGVSALPAAVDMTNIDQFLDRPGAKYVDLRNISDKYTAGYIDGFELVSFFEYLDGYALTRNNGWEYSKNDVTSKLVLENIFGSKNREVFLMCGSGTRAGYVKSALEDIGYKHVFNVGGIKDYNGKHMILGDESAKISLK